MPLRKSSKLPKRLARPVSKSTRRLVQRKYNTGNKRRREKLRRIFRRAQGASAQWKQTITRWCIGLVASAIVVAIGMMLFSPIMQLRDFRIFRLNPRLDIEHVQSVLTPLFGQHLAFLTTSEVTDLLEAEISDIAEVSVRKDYPSTLLVTIKLDPLVARLQIADPDKEDESTGTGSIADFITNKGVYIHVVTPGAEVLPLISVVDWGVRPIPGTDLIPIKLLERMNAAENALRTQFGHEIQERTVYLRAREFHLLADDISIWFDISTSLDRQLQRYRSLLQSIALEDIDSYIDLRLADRVVYR